MPGKFLFVSVLALSWSAVALAESKIGLVDLQKAILLTADGQKVRRTLESEFEKRQATLKKMEAHMRSLSEEFERKAALLAGDAKRARELELQSEMRHYQEAVTQNQVEMEKRQHELLEPIASKMSAIVAKLARKEGFSVVFTRADQLVLFAEKDADLTDAVARAYEHGAG